MRRVWCMLALTAVLAVGCTGAPSVSPTQQVVTVYRPTGVSSATATTETEMSSVPSTTVTESATTDSSATATVGTTTEGATTQTTITTATTVATVATAVATTERRGTVTTTTATTTTASITGTTAVPRPTVPSGEMRAAWVSYIELSELLGDCRTPAEAMAALDGLMAKLAQYRMNTVFFHVRANSDAYYDSEIFQPAAVVKPLLEAGFDPLAYAVQAANRQGLSLHAWINPYRVGKDADFAVDGVPTLRDDTGRQYYVPTSVTAQTLILDGVREIVMKYAVDGVQYDDYFYPENLLAEETVYDFERADYTAYTAGGGTLSVGDWRRAGVDSLIAATHAVAANAGRVFGVSPAANADNTYRYLYADCRKWLREAGYVDYLCPQIYTGLEHETQPFDKVLATWQGYERHDSVQLYVGVALYKIGLKSDTYAGSGKREWATHTDILQRSVLLLRERGIRGIGFYSYSYFEPASKAGFSADNDVTVAEAEVRNLLSVL